MVNTNFVSRPDFARCIHSDDELNIVSDSYGGWYRHFKWLSDSVSDTTGFIVKQGCTDQKFATEASPGEHMFAAEVANLRRKVIIKAQKDNPNDLHGAHLIVFKTSVKQTISGGHFENFSQAGNIGQYPIHFQVCSQLPASILSKNVVHKSNQRCVFIHATDKCNC